ncbi:tetratricopeptide repeat protein [uncultured Selenomonas sp.]|uniref:tetratricopeptide repeat protein n=1 Tax=uncultured Selenomonas sp. TaxID=159275 RepID=UPI0028DCE394|nr:tetratricopeptide repeat protein [uncultured Selenomonas sp.]
MTKEDFAALVELVLTSKRRPPDVLFAGGFDDWHARARLGHFLAMQEVGRSQEARELFVSILAEEVDEGNSEDIEEKAFALQRLSEIEHAAKEHEAALEHMNLAIELVENTDYLYKFILRGELWAARWNILHDMGRAAEAEAECDERIAAYEDVPVKHNSYLYYGYRFKAQLAAERGVVLVAKDYMHMALSEMEIPAEYEEALEKAFSATHENASWILNEIDRATPRPELLPWDI